MKLPLFDLLYLRQSNASDVLTTALFYTVRLSTFSRAYRVYN